MNRFIWKEGNLLSLKITNDLYCLCLLQKSPYILFFNIWSATPQFSEQKVSNDDILFIKGVTRQFLKKSDFFNTSQSVKLTSVVHTEFNWIDIGAGVQIIDVFNNTEDETSVVTLGDGHATLIQRDIGLGGNQNEIILRNDISRKDWDIISGLEITNLGTYPALNERLRLCHYFNKNVDPYKEIVFGRPIPTEYIEYVKILQS